MYNSALDFYFNHGEDWKKKRRGGARNREIKSEIMKHSLAPGRSSWLQAVGLSFHDWGLVHYNKSACYPQLLPTPDETLSPELHYKEGPRSQTRNEWVWCIQHSILNTLLGAASLTSQLTTTQLEDLHVVEGALHCSGAPGPVVTSKRSERGPNFSHEKNRTSLYNQKFSNYTFKMYLLRLFKAHWEKIIKSLTVLFSIISLSPQPCLLPWAGNYRFCQALTLLQNSPALDPGKPLCFPQTVARSFLYCSKKPGFLRLPEGHLGNLYKQVFIKINTLWEKKRSTVQEK